MLLLEAGKKEEGLDLLFLAAELLPSDTGALRRAEAALSSPGDLFLRLRLLRRILERNGDDPAALSGLARLYLEAGVRLGEAEKLAGRLAALQPGAENGSLLRSIQEKRKDSGG
jgi:Flp pilus assembly protein TadD